ncbi:MAG: arylsulfatase [Bacteroidales bacterium]|jgi:arylsulfatase|nr:arylsulfatase [Bacteroidales bacterium]
MKGITNINNKSIGLLSAALTLGTPAIAQYSPTPAFDGKIGKTLADTQEAFPQRNPKAPAGAPNIVWIHIDDIGYGGSSAFGGLIETPNLERLAKQGLRFTNYHTCAFSAPTRAALLTGRNQHSVHFGFFAHNSYNTPGYDGYLPFEKATAAEIFRENGYNTFALGKYHLTHPSDATQAGPFNRWPTGRGFDHYFGFPPEAWGTDQWHPILYRDTHREPEDPQGRHVTTLLANEAIKYIADQKSAAPDKPFFLYFSTGAGHEPHQVPKEWIDKYKGKFDAGWDKYRETVLENQKKLGVVPASAQLPPRNPDIVTWDSLSDKEKKLYARFMEVYAGFISHTDYEVGRILDFLEHRGQLENTLIVALIGDNGAEGAGGTHGTFLPNPPNTAKEQIIDNYLKHIDQLGTEFSAANYPAGWAAAANTPFRWYKGYPTFEGGTHNALIISYPKKIADKGGIRNQYTYVSDILPTTIELAGVKAPTVVNGYPQEPLEGVSLAYAIAPENKNLPERHTVQYHESHGSYGIYKDGWKAAFRIVDPYGRRPEVKKQVQLYNVREDFNELNDVSDKYPEKLKELADAFDAEAWKYNVYPLKGDNGWGSYTKNRNIFNERNKVTLYSSAYLLPFSIPAFVHTGSYSIVADVELPTAKDDGVLLASGGYTGGFGLFVKANKLTFAYNAEGKTTEIVSGKAVGKGKHSLKAEILQTPADRTRHISLYIDGEKVAEQKFESGLAYHSTEAFDIGRDTGTAVTAAYKPPFTFAGTINSVTLEKIQ